MQSALFEITVFVLVYHVLGIGLAFVLIHILNWAMLPALQFTFSVVFICERIVRRYFKSKS